MNRRLSFLDNRSPLAFLCRESTRERASGLHDVLAGILGYPSAIKDCYCSPASTSHYPLQVKFAVRSPVVVQEFVFPSAVTGDASNSWTRHDRKSFLSLRCSLATGINHLSGFHSVRCYSQTPCPPPAQPDDSPSVGDKVANGGQEHMSGQRVTFDPKRSDADQYYQQLKKLTLPPIPSSTYFGSLWVRFKTMYKAYWYVLIPVHAVLSLGWYGLFYVLALQ